MLSSARRAIVYPNPNRADTADVPRDFLAVVNALEIDVVYGQGTLAARPAFGLQGRLYCASDQTPKLFFWDNGTGWDPVGALTAGTIRGSTTGDVQQEILQGSVRRIDLSSQLKPSGTAVAADEALRALGATASTAAAGNDARLSDTRVPTAGSVTAAAGAAGAFAGQSYGTVFPTAGLYNGYRFTIFLTNPAGGSNMYDAIYRADLDATYPWHVEGAPLFNEVTTSQSTSSTTYVALATAGPSVTVPRAGVWQQEIGMYCNEGTGGATDIGIMSYDIGGTGAVDADAVLGAVSSGGTLGSASNARLTTKTISAASTALVAKYRANSGGSSVVQFQNRWMATRPIRLI